MSNLISVITVTYNSEESISKFLRSIQQNIDISYEVIIVDNNSSDKTVDKIKGSGVKVELIEAGENLGFARANNMAVQKAGGEFLFFLNPDTEILNPEVKLLWEFLRDHPKTGIAAPKLINSRGEVQPSVRLLPTFGRAFKEYVLGQKGNYDHFYPKSGQPVAVESVVGGAMVVRRDLYTNVGGFDNKYFMYYEDLDLCRKVLRHGFSIYYLPQVILNHAVGHSASSNPKVQQYLQNSFVLYHGKFISFFINLIYYFVRIKNKLRTI